MAASETPSTVMYAAFKELKISNKDVADTVLTDERSFGGQIPRQRIGERTFLFRLVHSEPGMNSESYFIDLPTAAQKLCSKMLKKTEGPNPAVQITDFLSGASLEDMRASLNAFGLDGALFSNVISMIQTMPGVNPTDQASMMVLAYLVVGCLGSPAKAANFVEAFAASIAARGFKTGVADLSGYIPEVETKDVRLGLARIVDGAMDVTGIHPLDPSSEGTVIGSLAREDNSINDVGPSVSRRHARVFRDEIGDWYIEGLGSTNGTTVIRGSDKTVEVVEAPKAERAGQPSPVLLQVGDTIDLAGTTQFLVLLVK